MKLTEFSTLSEAQIYPVTGSRMISTDMMIAFLATFGLYRAVLKEDTEAAAALKGALQSGSEFNLIKGHPSNVLSLIDQIDSATTDFKVHCIDYANPVRYPYANITQQEWDKAQALHNIKEQEVTYPSETFMLTTGRQGIDVEISTDIDCNFTCYLEVCGDGLDQRVNSNYIRIDQAVAVAKSSNGRAIISLSNRKVRVFNRIYIKPSVPCTFTTLCKANQG